MRLPLAGGVQPSGFQPGRRQAVAEGADQHEHEVDGGHGDERLPHADVGAVGSRPCSVVPRNSCRRQPFIRIVASGEPIMAPPPKPMMAMPVAMPRRSGNHLMSVETGEM